MCDRLGMQVNNFTEMKLSNSSLVITIPIASCVPVYCRSRWRGRGWMAYWKSKDKTAMDFKNISKLLSWWRLICCIHSRDSKSQPPPLLFIYLCSAAIFQNFSLFLIMPLFLKNNFISGDCLIIITLTLFSDFVRLFSANLWCIDCKLFIRLARCPQTEIQLCLRSVWVKCGVGWATIGPE